jgi:hypothetical protein
MQRLHDLSLFQVPNSEMPKLKGLNPVYLHPIQRLLGFRHFSMKCLRRSSSVALLRTLPEVSLYALSSGSDGCRGFAQDLTAVVTPPLCALPLYFVNSETLKSFLCARSSRAFSFELMDLEQAHSRTLLVLLRFRITQIQEVFLGRKLLTPNWRSPARCTPCRANRAFNNSVSVSPRHFFSLNSKEFLLCTLVLIQCPPGRVLQNPQ